MEVLLRHQVSLIHLHSPLPTSKGQRSKVRGEHYTPNKGIHVYVPIPVHSCSVQHSFGPPYRRDGSRGGMLFIVYAHIVKLSIRAQGLFR